MYKERKLSKLYQMTLLGISETKWIKDWMSRLDSLGPSERNLDCAVSTVYRRFCEIQLDNRSLSKASSVFLR